MIHKFFEVSRPPTPQTNLPIVGGRDIQSVLDCGCNGKVLVLIFM